MQKVVRTFALGQFILWSLFGWKRADGTRRFRGAYIEVARKTILAHDVMAPACWRAGIAWHGWRALRRGLATNLHHLGEHS